ncbi:serine/threonine-protein kinase 33-like isoform X1 [Diorhabda carinulata]|uniref:serine/threonine-protein kinase 33-like isoform X1 n=1 Tax=Diorhabda carinulata TaxID=1163345 RepID=UPI0025A078FF|nr:serine/threonine-protein kinase 33-like isoform X1 [Diorhabda carinulata]
MFLDETFSSTRQLKNGLKERDVKHVKLDDLKRLFEVFEFREQIGHGTFGIVVQAIDKLTTKEYAIKIVSKYYSGTVCLQEVYREIKILKSVFHENIILLDRVYETSKKIYMVFELCRETLLNKFKSSCPLSEKTIKKIAKQLISAVRYLHKNDIVHRDIKMENILLATNPDDESDEYFIKLTDFGLSVIKVGSGIRGMLRDRVGTILYMAPEILLDRTYSELCDLWSIGVILYLLVFEKYPFSSSNEKELMRKICETEPDYVIKDINNDCIDLLKSILKKDPAERITAMEMSKHPWLENRVTRRKDQTVIDYMKQWKREMLTVSSSYFDVTGIIPIVNDDLLTSSRTDYNTAQLSNRPV